MHDRKVGRANIDHLIVASSEVWVVDAKNNTGRVEHRNVGGSLVPPDNRIFVGGDRTKLATGLAWQVTAVGKRSETWIPRSIPRFVSRPRSGGCSPNRSTTMASWFTWASKLAELVAEAGELGPEQIEQVAARLGGERLRPAA